jgi:hypothetical protein
MSSFVNNSDAKKSLSSQLCHLSLREVNSLNKRNKKLGKDIFNSNFCMSAPPLQTEKYSFHSGFPSSRDRTFPSSEALIGSKLRSSNRFPVLVASEYYLIVLQTIIRMFLLHYNSCSAVHLSLPSNSPYLVKKF